MASRLQRTLLALLLAVPVSAQGVLRVPGDHATIQAAIAAAAPGTLVLVEPGVYKEQIDFLGKAISVVGVGGAGQTTIDSSGLQGWLDFPELPVVRFVNGEGPGSVLQGFTITGHVHPNSVSAPVWSEGTPTLVGCRISDNIGFLSGGFFGGGTLSGCEIVDNTSMSEGGGVRGDAQLFDCLVSGNSAQSSHGGGIFATGALRAERCEISFNSSVGDGHSGAVFGPAVLVQCLLVGNSGDSFAGQNEGGATAVDGALLVDRCTVTENVFFGPGGYAVRAQSIVNSIVWNNTQGLGSIASGQADYSCVEGGAVGTGNLAVDPLFVDPLAGDFHLERTSPCVDAGDPLAAPDPDGTRADMGAFFVPQHLAAWSFRFGTFVPPTYVPQANPVLGTTFAAQVTATPSTTATAIFIHPLPSSPIPTPFGELLVDPNSPQLLLDVALPSMGFGTHLLTVPNDTGLIGATFASQAIRLGPSPSLTNAVDYLLGL